MTSFLHMSYLFITLHLWRQAIPQLCQWQLDAELGRTSYVLASHPSDTLYSSNKHLDICAKRGPKWEICDCTLWWRNIMFAGWDLVFIYLAQRFRLCGFESWLGRFSQHAQILRDSSIFSNISFWDRKAMGLLLVSGPALEREMKAE